jgi:signal transduction histidine kinase
MLGGMTGDGHSGAPGARPGLPAAAGHVAVPGAGDDDGPEGAQGGRSVLPAAEVSAFVVLAVVDAVAGLRGGFVWSGIPHSAGVAAAVVAVLRRRLPLPAAGAGALALAAIAGAPGPSTMAVLAAAVIVGAACRRLKPLVAAALSLAGAAVMVEAGRARLWSAVAGAVLWGVAVAVGLMLRDADARRRASAAEARTAERLRIARELHDVVAHHVTGIVVLAQASGVVADKRDPAATAGYAEIEDAAKEALTAMRRLVRTLRSDEVAPERTDDLERSLRIAVGDDPRVRLTVGDVRSLPPRVVATAYWLTLEALTNARKHAPGAAEITVSARTENEPFDAALRIAIVNDAVAAQPRGEGFGLVGMAERVREVGGTLRAGPTGGGRWEVVARLPLDGPVERGV